MVKNVTIRIKAFLCVVLSFLGVVNYGVLIWISGKIKSKKLKITSVAMLVLLIGSFVMFVCIEVESTLGTALAFIILILLVLPIVIVLLVIGEYIRCQTLEVELQENNIKIQELEPQMCMSVEIPEDSKLLKTSQRVYGEKGEVVLRAITFKKQEKQWEAQRKKEEKEFQKLKEKEEEKYQIRLRAEAEKAKAEAQKAEAEKAKAEAEKAKMQAQKVEAEKVKAEAEKARAEAEKAKAQAQKAEAEKAKAEAEKAKMQAQKVEAEKAKAEAEKARAEAEKAKAQAQKAEAEKAKAEAEKVKMQMENQQRATEEKQVKKRETMNNVKSSKGLVDVNTCSEQELALISGIGIILAKKAVTDRNKNGDFVSKDDFIARVGIREANIELVKSNIECIENNHENAVINRKHSRKIDF